jgi:hypothetical protein
MNNQIDFTQPGGLFTYQDTFDFLQASYSDAINAIAAMYGDKVIVQGLVASGGSITDGWVVYTDPVTHVASLIPVHGGSLLNYLHLVSTLAPEQFADGTTKNVYTTKNFVFTATSGGNIAFSTFKRLPYNSATLNDAFTNVKTILQKIINTESAVILSGCAVSSVVDGGSGSGTATISAGFVLMDGEIVTPALRTAGAWPCWLKPDGTYVTADPGGTNVKFDWDTSQHYADVLRRQQYTTGGIYISVNEDDLDWFDVASGFGKWRWLGFKLSDTTRSRVLIGYDRRSSGPSDNVYDNLYNTVGSTLGENKHQLTPSEMPTHTHGLPNQWNEGGGGHIASGGNTDEGAISDRTGSAGGDEEHESRQPSVVVLMFERR